MIIDHYRAGIGSGGPDPKVDEHFSNVVLLSGFEGSNGSQVIVDESSYARTMTAVAGAQLTTSAPLAGNSSLLLDGSDDRVQTPDAAELAFGSQNFCIETLVRFSAFTGGAQNTLVSQRASTNNRAWDFRYDAIAEELEFLYSTNGSAVTIFASAWEAAIDTTYHVAADRRGSALRLFVQGQIIGEHNIGTASIFNSTAALVIGAIADSLGFLNGRLDEMRITVGVSRYAESFTPPLIHPRIGPS